MKRPSPSVLTAGLLGIAACVAVAVPLTADPPGPLDKKTVLLHNGWKVAPAGEHQAFGDLLMGGALSPDGKLLAFVNGGGAAHNLHLADGATGRVLQSLPLERAQSSGGMVWSPDGNTLYVAGGNSGSIFVFTRGADGTVTAAEPITLPDIAMRPEEGKGQAFLMGVAAAADGRNLYLANLGTDTVYKWDLAEKKVVGQRKLGENDRPGCLRLSPDGKALAVALWARGQVVALDPATLETKGTYAVAAHPNDLRYTKDGSRLFVSCGNADAVLVLDGRTGQQRERISSALTPKAPMGATPSALALSPDERTLYVANSDNNSVAVVDIEKAGASRVKGFIPTAQYPTMVTVSADGRRLYIGTGKGLNTGPNGQTNQIDPVAPKGYPYIVTLLKGILSTVAVPDEKTLAAYTKQVYANSAYISDDQILKPTRAPRPGSNPIPSKVGDPSPIKYVLYIIKENRTYDQVFGDMTDRSGKRIGNGDPKLTLFGEDVTPNHHQLAREFLLFDNLYCNGEVSVDGHHWSNGAYVPDFMQRTWPAQYGGKGAPPLTPELAETPAGRLWDLCRKANVSYKTYYYHTRDTMSEEWAAARRAGQRDYLAADIFLKDLAEYERTGNMPRFQVMALSEDHTRGTTPGAFTPKACVASNDLAVGKIIEALSKSRFWKEMAVFIIEDDAQNGPDHVDAHRTVGLVISPYTRRAKVGSTFYTTVSFLRTMELILGLPPMSQYDAAATPMYNAFQTKPDLTPYTVCQPRTDLAAKNAPTAYGAALSKKLNFSAPDLLTEQDEDTLNRVLWHSIKGKDSPYPVPVRRGIMDHQGRPVLADDDDD
jgi:YVTN family beta-propeller protein